MKSAASASGVAEAVVDPDDWSSGDLDTARAMVSYLLDELQPQLWTKRKDAISTFSGYFFRTNPALTDLDIEALLVGDGSRKGLLHACGQVSWKSFRLKKSSFSALDLLLDLINPERNRESDAFVRVFVRLDENLYRAIKLQKHMNNKATKAKAFYIVSLLQRHNRSVPLDDGDDGGSHIGDVSRSDQRPAANGPDAEATPTGGNTRKGGNISNIVSKLSNFLARRPQMQTLMTQGIVRAPSVFGRQLSDVIADGNVNGIPTFFIHCCDFLREHGIHKVGIFRVSGEQQEVNRIKHMIDYDDELSLEGVSPHSVAGIVKLFVRELPEPLLTFSRYHHMVEAARQEDHNKLDELVDGLPQHNLALFQYLCEFLAEVSLKVATNKMTPSNLAIVFAPNLMHPEVENFEAVARDTPVTIAAVKHFIERALTEMAAQSVHGLTLPELPLHDDTPLPAPWTEYLDESTGVPFYYNLETGDSCWDRPGATDVGLDMVNVSEVAGLPHSGDPNMDPALLADNPVSATDGGRSKPAFILELDDDSKARPRQGDPLHPKLHLSSSSGLPSGWEQFHDETTGTPYFYNRITGTSLWDRPTTSDECPPPPPPELSLADGKGMEFDAESTSSLEPKMRFEGAWTAFTAGGCFPDVTWFQNPQYLVRVPSKVGCVVRFDLAALGHCTHPIGVHVVHVPVDRGIEHGRILSIPSDDDLLAIGPFDPDLRAIASVQVEVPATPDEDYTQIMVVPATEIPGVQSRFELLVACDQACEVIEVVDVVAGGEGWRCTKVEGEWVPGSAGGCYPNFMTWRDNPQFRLDVCSGSGPTRALVHLKRGNDDSDGAIGFYVLKNSGPAMHKLCISDGDVVLRSEFVAAGDVVAEVLLEQLGPGKPDANAPRPCYVILPCSYSPNLLDTFHVSVFSEHSLRLSAIPDEKRWASSAVKGRWTPDTSGGCRNFDTWKQNPTFELQCREWTPALVVLSQPDPANILPIGFYVVNRSGKVRGKGPFMVAPEVFVEMNLDPREAPYTLLPCTFNPGQLGEFVVRTFTTTPTSMAPRIRQPPHSPQ